MKRDIRDKWVAALRSGDYTQGACALKREDGSMCCLGVLCDLALEELGIAWDTELSVPNDKKGYLILGIFDYLPEQVREWAGLKDIMGTRNGGLSLYQLNDVGRSFTQIAAIIEKEF